MAPHCHDPGFQICVEVCLSFHWGGCFRWGPAGGRTFSFFSRIMRAGLPTGACAEGRRPTSFSSSLHISFDQPESLRFSAPYVCRVGVEARQSGSSNKVERPLPGNVCAMCLGVLPIDLEGREVGPDRVVKCRLCPIDRLLHSFRAGHTDDSANDARVFHRKL